MKKKIFFLAVVLLVIGVLWQNSQFEFYMPKIQNTDISDAIKDENYDMIFTLTGVSPLSAKKLIDNGNEDVLLKLNGLYLKKPDYKKEYIFYPLTSEERNLTQITPFADIQNGDILVTFNTKTLLWRHGHLGIVLDSERGVILEHSSLGHKSGTATLSRFGTYPAFLVLRYTDEECAKNAAEYAKKKLIGINYSIFAGLIKKDKTTEVPVSSSHCSHIIWQAYKAQGVDFDQNGGRVVTPADVANSELLKVVQIYGINPEKYSGKILR